MSKDQKIISIHRLSLDRRSAAGDAIQIAGGPRKLAKMISDYLEVEVDEKRIAKWRAIGVPVRWGVIVEHLTGVKREKLNPYEYTTNLQVVHKRVSRDYLVRAIAFR